MTNIYRATFLVAALLLSIAEVRADGVFPLRNQNPFLQIYGLPTFQSAMLAESGGFKFNASLDIINDAEATENSLESLVIDGESYIATLSLRRRVAERLELGIDVPIVSHSGGFLDHAIEDWHDLLGLSNSRRTGPAKQLHFMYESVAASNFELTSSAVGIGDIQLAAAVPFGPAFAIRAAVKLPTGDADKLHGSGATDLSLGLYASRVSTLFKRKLGLSGFAGVLLLGDGDVLPEIQRSEVMYGGVAARWQATERFGFAAQIYAQGSYYKSDLSDIGGKTVQYGIGGDYRLPKRELLFRLAIVEDIATGATPDFALHFSISSLGS